MCFKHVQLAKNKAKPHSSLWQQFSVRSLSDNQQKLTLANLSKISKQTNSVQRILDTDGRLSGTAGKPGSCALKPNFKLKVDPKTGLVKAPQNSVTWYFGNTWVGPHPPSLSKWFLQGP